MSEEATETGMLHGIDAYNDSMGQGLRSPDPCGHHCTDDCPRCYEPHDNEEEERRQEELWMTRGGLEDLHAKIAQHERYIEQLQERLRIARGRPPHPHSKDGGPASDASHLCPDCTWHRMVLVRGMWRCPGCNNH